MKAKYFCEKCGYEYDTAEAAQWCEDIHGEVIESRVMPGKVYSHQCICPDIVYVKFRNQNGQEIAGRYQFVKCEDKDFEKVKQRSEKYPYIKF